MANPHRRMVALNIAHDLQRRILSQKEIRQVRRLLSVLRLYFQNDIGIVGRTANPGDRALAEPIIKQILDVSDRCSPERGASAVDVDGCLKPERLVVPHSVPCLWQRLDALKHDPRPTLEFFLVQGTQDILVAACAAAGAETDVLHRSKKRPHSLDLFQLLAQPRDNLLNRFLTHVQAASGLPASLQS